MEDHTNLFKVIKSDLENFEERFQAEFAALRDFSKFQKQLNTFEIQLIEMKRATLS